MSISSVTSEWYSRRWALGGTGGVEQPAERLTKYIPTEAIALFVPTMSFIGAATASGTPKATSAERALAAQYGWIAYFTFLFVLTPGIVLLIAVGKQKAANQPFAFPTWPLLSSCFAFAGWALAVPGLLTQPVWQAGVGVIALFISVIIGLFEPILGGQQK